MLTTKDIEKALNIRSSFVKGGLVLCLFAVYWLTVYFGSNAVGPLLDKKVTRVTINAISTMDVLKPAKDELSLLGIYVDSLLKASTPIFYTMALFGLLGVILTNNSVLSLLRKTSAHGPNNDQEDRLKENIYTVLEFAKVKLGTGYFFPALLCVIYGGFTIGASVHLLFAQELKGLSSFIVAIVSMLILVVFGILGFKYASIDLRKVTLSSAFLSFFFAIVLTGYSAYKDLQTKRNILKLSEHIIDLVKENQELNRELQKLNR